MFGWVRESRIVSGVGARRASKEQTPRRRFSLRRRLRLELLEDRSLLSAGVLDFTFDGDGKVNTFFGATDRDDQAYSVAIQNDDGIEKIVVAGYTTTNGKHDFAIARYLPNGQLDPDFGGGTGKVVTSFGSERNARVYGVAIQRIGSQDRIVVAGSTWTTNASNRDFALARYMSDGTPDSGFNGGRVMEDFLTTQRDNAIFSVGIQPGTNKIVVAGTVFDGSSYDFILARYNDNGVRDTMFGGTSGFAISDSFVVGDDGASPRDDQARALAFYSDGRVVAAGFTQDSSNFYYFAVARYTAGGGVDTTFNPSGGAGKVGKVALHFASNTNDQAYGVALQNIASTRRIVVVGQSQVSSSNTNFAIARFGENGAPDASFDGDGRRTDSFGSGHDRARGVAVDEDNRIVVVGYSLQATNDFALARYNVNGSLDTGFDGSTNGNGKITTAFGTGDDQAYGVALQSDGRIVVAGLTFRASNNYDFAVARYFGAAAPEIAVYYVGAAADVEIFDGSLTTSAVDGTAFGSVPQGSVAVSRTYRIRNLGSEPLNLLTGAGGFIVSVPDGFTVTQPSTASLNPNTATNFTVRLETADAGVKSGDLSFGNNDANENPFNFRITGTVTGPEVAVYYLGAGGDVEIFDGSSMTSSANGTDFGSVDQGGPAVGRTYRIRNLGTATLNLVTGTGGFVVTVPDGFSVTQPLSTSLGPNASTTFSVSLQTVNPGIKAGDVRFGNSDANENPFNYRITGTVIAVLQADYNQSGKVDAADYVLWRKSNINGPAGYSLWRTNFGKGSGDGSGVEDSLAGEAAARALGADVRKAEESLLVGPVMRMHFGTQGAMGVEGLQESNVLSRNVRSVSARVPDLLAREAALMAWLVSNSGGEGARKDAAGEEFRRHDDACSVANEFIAVDAVFAEVPRLQMVN